jgi:hypothetical protein
MRSKSVRGNRRGVSLVQAVTVLAVVTVISIGSYFALGTATEQGLQTTATGAGNPSALVSHFNTPSQ